MFSKSPDSFTYWELQIKTREDLAPAETMKWGRLSHCPSPAQGPGVHGVPMLRGKEVCCSAPLHQLSSTPFFMLTWWSGEELPLSYQRPSMEEHRHCTSRWVKQRTPSCNAVCSEDWSTLHCLLHWMRPLPTCCYTALYQNAPGIWSQPITTLSRYKCEVNLLIC